MTNKGYNVVQVNPATTKRNKENRDNSHSKSDPKDALVIADVVSFKDLLYLFEQLPQLPDPKNPEALDSLLPWSPSLPMTCRVFKFA